MDSKKVYNVYNLEIRICKKSIKGRGAIQGGRGPDEKFSFLDADSVAKHGPDCLESVAGDILFCC